MRTLRAGIKPAPYPWMGRYLCCHCDSVFELTAEDSDVVKRWDDDQRDGMSVTVMCPVCQQERALMEYEKSTTYDLDKRAGQVL